MFSLFNNKDIQVYYQNKNTFIFIGNNYENQDIDNIIYTLSSYVSDIKNSLYFIFINSSNEHLFNLSQEVAQNCSTMYPGRNKHIILDNNKVIEQFSRFGNVVLLEEMFDSNKYKSDSEILEDNRIQIQCGCMNNCKFCVNEQHKSVSVSHLDIIKQINKSLKSDIMLSGVNISSYNDGEVSLAGLCKCIFNNCECVKKVLLSGLDLQQFEEVKEVINVIKDYDKVYPILHFPIHTCNQELLKENNLDYTVEQIEEIMTLCQKNNILYSWDIICGLPNETDEMFNDTLEMVKKYKPVVVYIYPFKLLSSSNYNEFNLIEDNVIKQRCYDLANVITGYKEDTLKLLENPKYEILKDYITNFDIYSKFLELISENISDNIDK